MNSINVDHGELFDFSVCLSKEGAAEFEDIKTRIETSLGNIQSSGWSDNKFLEFNEIFQASKKDIEEIRDLMDYYSRYLANKAEKVGEYQNCNIY